MAAAFMHGIMHAAHGSLILVALVLLGESQTVNSGLRSTSTYQARNAEYVHILWMWMVSDTLAALLTCCLPLLPMLMIHD